MAHAQGEATWQHTSSQLALLYNINRGKNAPSKSPLNFNPYSGMYDGRTNEVITDLGSVKHHFTGESPNSAALDKFDEDGRWIQKVTDKDV